MKESLSIFITVIVLVLLIVIFPLYNYFERQDDMSYNLVLKSTTEFIDEIRNCGYISQQMYTDYISQIANTGNLYDIQLEAYKKVLVRNDSGTEYNEQYLIDYNNDIFSNDVVNGSSSIDNKVIKNGVYRLNVGDKIFIKLKNSSTTMAGALFNIIVPTSSPETIKINYGGIVQNNTWKESETALFEEFNFKIAFDLNTNGDNNANYNSDDLKNGIKTTIYTGSNVSTVTIPDAIPTRTNCTFKGWTTDKNSKTVKYNAGSKIKLDSNITLYAVWEEGNVTITFDPNGGTIKAGDSGTKSVKYGNQILLLPTAVLDGYKFEGWYTSATGGTRILPTTKVETTNNITYYAHWKLKNVIVTFEYNGATSGNSNANKEVIVSNEYGSLPSPLKAGHTFAGWYLDSGLTQAINSNSIVTITTNHTLYAKWTPNTYTITFNGNGGNSSTLKLNYGAALGNLPTSTRTGYTFAGWYTTSTGGTKITNTTLVTGNVTYYAHWNGNSYTNTLSYNANGGSGAPSAQTQSVKYPNTAKVFTVSSTKPSRTAYVFSGWYTAASGGSLVGSTITVGANNTANNQSKTIYAHWALETFSAKVVNVKSGSVLYIREGQSTSTTILGYLYPNEIVTVLDATNSTWWKVKKSDGTIGYSNTGYLQRQ